MGKVFQAVILGNSSWDLQLSSVCGPDMAFLVVFFFTLSAFTVYSNGSWLINAWKYTSQSCRFRQIFAHLIKHICYEYFKFKIIKKNYRVEFIFIIISVVEICIRLASSHMKLPLSWMAFVSHVAFIFPLHMSSSYLIYVKNLSFVCCSEMVHIPVWRKIHSFSMP